MKLTLRLQLTLWYTAAILVVLGVLFFSLNKFLTNRLNSEVDSDLFNYSASVQELVTSAPPTTPEDYRLLLRRLSAARLGSRPEFARVLDLQGHTIATYPDLPQSVNNLLTSSSDKELPDKYLTLKLPKEAKVRMYTREIRSSDDQLLGILQVGESLRRVNQVLNKLRSTLLVEAVVGVFVALAVGYALAWYGLRPLQRVIRVAQGIHEKNLSARIPTAKGTLEVQQLTETFNSMLDRVDKAFEQQRRFSGDVSHELRTPITALRTQIEVMLMDPDLPVELGPRLEQLEQETTRLIRLTPNMLLLSQLDAKSLIDRRPIDLTQLLHEVYHEAHQLLDDSTRLLITKEEPATVLGDYSLMKQVLLNLVDNAIKYTHGEGEVKLALEIKDSSAEISVSDTGVGIPADALGHVFEPFYRAETSRSKAPGGAGLGLTTSRSVVERHGGQIHIESAEGQGTTVTVLLPLAKIGA